MINLIIRESSQLAQKECKTWHNCVRMMNPKELYKKLKCNLNTKWNMHYKNAFYRMKRFKIFGIFKYEWMN